MPAPRISAPKIYGSRRTKATLSYSIGDQHIETNNLQMEIDLTCEHNGEVVIFEGKNGFSIDFAIYQIYLPFLYYYRLKQNNKLDIEKIHCCYLLREKREKETIIRIYQYGFKEPENMASINLIKSSEYQLQRSVDYD